MVGKIMKHEIKNTWIEVVAINAALLVATLILQALFLIDAESYFGGLVVGVFWFITVAGYFISAAVLVINVVKSFNKRMFSDEGYLSLTLPVSIDALIISKVLVNLMWILISIINYILCFVLMFDALAGGIFGYIVDILKVLFNNPLFTLIHIFWFLLNSIMVIMILLFTLSLLHIGKVQKLRLLAGLGIFFGVNIIVNIIEGIVNYIPIGIVNDNGFLSFEVLDSSAKLNYGNGVLFTGLTLNSIIGYIAIIVGLFFLTRNLIKNKLEL